jgi:hypothetical protein
MISLVSEEQEQVYNPNCSFQPTVMPTKILVINKDDDNTKRDAGKGECASNLVAACVQSELSSCLMIIFNNMLLCHINDDCVMSYCYCVLLWVIKKSTTRKKRYNNNNIRTSHF